MRFPTTIENLGIEKFGLLSLISSQWSFRYSFIKSDDWLQVLGPSSRSYLGFSYNDFFIMLSTMTFLIMLSTKLRKSCLRNMWMFPNQVVIMLSTTTKFDELQIIVVYVNFTLSTLTNFYFVHINQNISMGVHIDQNISMFSTLTKTFECCPHWSLSTLDKVHIG